VVGTFASRFPFLIAAALIAAAIADPVVESISNTGVFGGGYDDNNHLGVVPTLLAGLLLAAEMLVMRFIEIVRRSANRSHRSLIDVARGFAARPIARDFPCVFAVQLLALVALESSEQLIAGGELLGGTAWLGGPIVFSLLMHGLIGAGCTLALGVCMRSILQAFASIVLTVIRFTWLAIARTAGSGLDLDRQDTVCWRAQAPHVCRIGGRAPPRIFSPA
jgi:hypothetical protein